MTTNLRILVIGDPHFQEKYLTIVDEFIERTLKVIQKQKPDLVCVLGDTLHKHEVANQSCHSRACNFFKRISIHSHLIVLIGNHDRPNNANHCKTNNEELQETHYAKHFFGGLKGHKNISIIDEVASIELEKSNKVYRLVFVPYVPAGDFNKELSKLKVSILDKKPLAIFAHQEFKGAKMGAIISSKGDEWPEENPLIISGHIHEYQIPQENIIYVGTPFQTTYTESRNKGIYMFNFKSKETDMMLIKMNMRVKESFTILPQEFADFEIPENTDVRLIVRGPSEEVAALRKTQTYRDLQKQGVKIVLRPIIDIKKQSVISYDKKYSDILYEQIRKDPDMRQLYEQLFT